MHIIHNFFVYTTSKCLNYYYYILKYICMGLLQELYTAASKGSLSEIIAALDKGGDIKWRNPEVDEE